MASPSFPQPHTPSDGQLERDTDLLIQNFLPPPGPPPAYAAPSLPLPFCVPQIAPSYEAPFARGFNPAINAVGVPQDEFLAFIDGLNNAITASPPLRVVDVAGKVIGFIPYHWTIIAGAVMQTVAQTGMHILSKTLTDRYLRAANERIFHPRNLSVRLCTSAAMQEIVKHSGNGAGPSTLDKIGRGVGTVLLHAPIPFSSRIVRSIADRPPKVPPSISSVGDGQYMTLSTQRRLAALEGHALPVNFEVPPPAKPADIMGSINQFGVKFDTWRTNRKESRIESRRRELARVNSALQQLGINPGQVQGPIQAGGSTQYLDWRDRREVRRAARRERRRERHGPGLIGSLIGPKESRLERRVKNADLLEHWAADKVLWVVIMNKDLDKTIGGLQHADGKENMERVDAETWKNQVLKEKEELDAESSDSESEDEDEADRKH
ncbi:hypothetical protein MIND_00828500 [Mycena indigotica]|uniref:Uncharacterized protein n=1 Tax=Mycena indigotica TaxID=2126181 RepID=A0A8H6W4C1_9AGAR|nr:uncharacterized protein MIND_00828500 [Mycena indigotica]KAF7298809.1 hypothetical protein MIND_00828500 [Mycena indigotica]